MHYLTNPIIIYRIYLFCGGGEGGGMRRGPVKVN